MAGYCSTAAIRGGVQRRIRSVATLVIEQQLGNGFTCECCNEIDRLSDAIAVVLELHEPDGDYCGECSIHDAVTYPCPTVVAIRTALGEGEK